MSEADVKEMMCVFVKPVSYETVVGILIMLTFVVIQELSNKIIAKLGYSSMSDYYQKVLDSNLKSMFCHLQ